MAAILDPADVRLCACKDAFEPAGGQPELCTEAAVPSPQTKILTLGLSTGPGLQAENAGLGGEEKEAEDGPHGQGPRSGSDGERLEMKSKTRGQESYQSRK